MLTQIRAMVKKLVLDAEILQTLAEPRFLYTTTSENLLACFHMYDVSNDVPMMPLTR
jgi:hypothetical protein